MVLLYNMNNMSKIFFLCIVDAGTKTLVVHGQNECDIPTQLPVHEDTQFEALLKVVTLYMTLLSSIEHLVI